MTFNLWTFLFEVVNFVVLAYVLHRLLYRPLREAIAARQAEQARILAEAEQSRATAADMQAQLQAKLGNIDQERDTLIQQAREQIDADRRRVLAEAEQVAQRRRAELQQDLTRERQELWDALRGDVVQHATDLAEHLLQDVGGSDLHHRLLERLILILENPEEQKRLVGPSSQGGEAILESAAAVDDAQVERIAQVLSASCGRPITVAVRINPALVSGARLRSNGSIWDASVAGQWDESQQSIRGASGVPT